MGLMKKIFGGATPVAGSPGSLPFKESQLAVDQVKSRNEPRRELVKVVLRDTMRKHGIPTDWIDCRILSVMTRQHKSGLHVQFLVRKADDQLLPYLHAFQESFHQQIARFDPQVAEWLFSVAWQFYGKATRGFSPMPDPSAWADTGDVQAGAGGHGAAPHDAAPHEDTEDLASDLQALQAAISQPAELTTLPAAPAGRPRGPSRP